MPIDLRSRIDPVPYRRIGQEVPPTASSALVHARLTTVADRAHAAHAA
ncbi:hypothetical protein [uncultured Amnibacterium sp.]